MHGDSEGVKTRPLVVVAFDPLCGWCFGFEPVLTRLRIHYAGRLRFRVAMGGLVTGERERPMRLDADYLKRGLETVRARTGVSAGEAFFRNLLEPGDWISRSEPPCRAIMITRDLAGDEAALDLAATLTRALYSEGLRLDDPNVIHSLALRHDLPADDLVRLWLAPDAADRTGRMFRAERQRGISSYPSLFLERDESIALETLVSGCDSFEIAIGMIDQAALAGA